MAAFNDGWHLAVEKRQQQSADMGAIDVGVGHQDDFVIAQFFNVEFFPANAGTQSRDQSADFS